MSSREGYRWSPRIWQPSEAQRRVLDGVAAGESNRTIAERTGLSTETVKWHVRELLAETESTDRTDLGRWWTEQQSPQAMAMAA